MTVGARRTDSDDCSIGPMLRADIAEVAALERRIFAGDSPWTEAMFRGELNAGHQYWVVRSSGRVVGYAGLAVSFDDADVQTIGLAEEFRGRGLGRTLLNLLLQAAGPRTVHLEVRTDNVPAIALYESVGFERVGVRRRYYQPSGADAYAMLRENPAGAGAILGE